LAVEAKLLKLSMQHLCVLIKLSEIQNA